MATLANRKTGSFATVLITDAGLDALAGAWLFLSAFLFFRESGVLFVNNLACGAMAAVLAFGAFAHIRMSWLPAAIGLWVMISPFALGFGADAMATANNVITGALIFAFAIHEWSVSKSAHDAGMMGE
jgi:hypothetical protein